MTTAESLRRIADAVTAWEHALAQADACSKRLDAALVGAGALGAAIRGEILGTAAHPGHGLPADPRPAWIAPVIVRPTDQDARVEELVQELTRDEPPELQAVDEPAPQVDEPAPQVDVLTDPVVTEALAATVDLIATTEAPIAGTLGDDAIALTAAEDRSRTLPAPEPEQAPVANAPEAPDGSIDLDKPIAPYAFAKLLGVHDASVRWALKSGAIPSRAVVQPDKSIPPRIIPRIAARAWRPAAALERLQELGL